MSRGSLCARCRHRPVERGRERTSPLTTLYWDSPLRHAGLLAGNTCAVMRVRDLERLSDDERVRTHVQATPHLAEVWA